MIESRPNLAGFPLVGNSIFFDKRRKLFHYSLIANHFIAMQTCRRRTSHESRTLFHRNWTHFNSHDVRFSGRCANCRKAACQGNPKVHRIRSPRKKGQGNLQDLLQHNCRGLERPGGLPCSRLRRPQRFSQFCIRGPVRSHFLRTLKKPAFRLYSTNDQSFRESGIPAVDASP